MELKYAPYAAIIDQTVLCNQECGFCWRTDRDQVKAETNAAPFHVMPFELYCTIVDAVAQVSTLKSLSLCGPMGEPTLVPDLAERGFYARTQGIPAVLINTNGVALNKHDPILLVQAFTDIQISLDADDEQTYAAIHGKRGQFEQVVQNIHELVRAKRKIGPGAGKIRIRCTETGTNHEWPKIVDRWDHLVDGFIHKYVHTFVDVLPKRKGLASESAEKCNQPHGSINFTYTGDLTTCCINWHREPTFGRLGEGKTLKELWEGETFETWRRTRLSGICQPCSGLGAVSQRIGY